MRTVIAVSLSCALVSACAPPLERPPTREVVELRGTPRERGFQHGQALKSKIHSFYTTLLTNSLFPYLSREQPDIATLMPRYAGADYQDGKFAWQLLLDSARSIETSFNPEMREELRGIAEGAELEYEKVLVLNTFFDTTMAVRAIALAIRLSRAPQVTHLSFIGAENDGVDNDGDGAIDEPGEGVFEPYEPALYAHAVELPAGTTFRLVLEDADGVDPATVRIFLNNELFTAGNPALVTNELSDTELEVLLTPPAPLPAAARITLVVGAGDKVVIHTPAPSRASFMRDEEITFTTVGAGLTRHETLRPELTDGRTRPPPIAFGVRGSMTDNGSPYLAQHFALLDANTAWKHTIALRHVPDDEPAFVTIGWAGVIFGLSGMSERGVGYVCNPADTLDNSVTGSVLQNIFDLANAQLIASGLPVGLMGRVVLEQAHDATQARDIMHATPPVYGWTCLTADSSGALLGAEFDADVFGESGDGFYEFETGGVNSVGADDLIISSNYMVNVPDSPTLAVAGQRIIPQRSWSGMFNRSRRAFDGVKERLTQHNGPVNVDFIQNLLSEPRFVDQSDSMNAVVLDFENLQIRQAMGAVPATSMPFEVVEVRP